ncbi:MAG: hypothetical protein A2V85_13705 [Chloroflexi bacterium RBG_16_72_14]|nr:MAG: hypothetical protein A2V85_13705 [Chloroflexi bacterium RBG_16_72_14]
MNPLRRRSGGPALVAVLLLVAACGSPGPSATPTAPPATASPTPSPSATASPGPTPTPVASDDHAALYEEIETQVAELRGLQPTKPVDRAVLDEAGLREFVTTSFNEDNPEELVVGFERLYKALLLMPEDESLEDLYVELLTSQVAGLYDDETKRMYVITRTGDIGPIEKVTYAHEFAHALQDQAFGLRALVGEATDQGDRTLARTTLAEGDATLVMSLWAQQHLTPAELAEAGSASDPEAEAVLARMPAILKEPLLFPYTAGLALTFRDFQGGGFAAVDARYQDPPDSTEQVLHDDKLESNEQPVKVAFPADLAGRLGTGWTVSLQDTLGEFQLEIVLRDGGGSSGSVSANAAAGWGGDRVALVEGPDGATGVVLDTAWDTRADAREFAAALDGLVASLKAAGRSASVLTPGPRRVVLVTADSDRTLGRLANVLGLAG